MAPSEVRFGPSDETYDARARIFGEYELVDSDGAKLLELIYRPNSVVEERGGTLFRCRNDYDSRLELACFRDSLNCLSFEVLKGGAVWLSVSKVSRYSTSSLTFADQEVWKLTHSWKTGCIYAPSGECSLKFEEVFTLGLGHGRITRSGEFSQDRLIPLLMVLLFLSTSIDPLTVGTL